MDINDALTLVEDFLARYQKDHDDFQPTEVRVLPSGDERDAIKITINFGPDADEGAIDELERRAIAALEAAHPELTETYTLEARALAD